MKTEEIKNILSKLKIGLIAAKKYDESFFGSPYNNERNYKEFYLLDSENNFFENSNDLELGTGIRAVKSSAAFIYNIFGQDEITIDGIKYPKIEYEKQLEALINRPKAHLDGYLHSESKSIFFETKLLEWSGYPKNLAIAYLDKKNYPEYNDNVIDFISYFNTLVKDNTTINKYGVERRVHKTKVYDAIQMGIHILGIYNAVCDKKILTQNIELINLVWDYKCKRYLDEEKEAIEEVDEMNRRFQPLFKSKGFTFTVKYIPFSNFINDSNITIKNPDRIDYLIKRYLIK